MMEKKIVCINQYHLNPRSKRLSYVETFQRTGIKFEYWDTTEIFSMSEGKAEEREDPDYVKKYSSLEDIEKALSLCDCKQSLFFIGVPERLKDRLFFKLLSDHGCRIIKVDQCANTLRIKKDVSDYISFLCSPTRVVEYFKRALLRKYFNKYNIRYFDVFSSSALGNRTRSINHPDYDDYQTAIKRTMMQIAEKPYAVFYDSYFPLHPDFKYIHKLKMKVDYGHYLKSMNMFFDWIEKKYNLKVVIAAHPSSEYSPNDFDGREIIKWHTCELTLKARIIINQSSNSTSFALLANKPIVFITSDDIEKCDYLSRYIDTLSQALGKEKYNIDGCDYDSMIISPVQENLRHKYIYTYLTDKSIESKTNDEIFTEYVKSHIN